MSNKLASYLLLSVFILPSISLAQQDVMVQMKAVAECMESINKQDLKKIEQEGDVFSKKVESLCAQGKKSQAQNLALEFSQKIKDSKVIEHIQSCIEKIPAAMREMMPSMMPEKMMDDFTKSNVCDRH